MMAAVIRRETREGTIMDQLRFDSGLGNYSVSVAPESVWISRGMGTHYLQIQLEVGVPQVEAAAGRLLCLETTLYARRPTVRGCRSGRQACPFPSTRPVRSVCRQCNTSSPTPSCWPWNSIAPATCAWNFR